MKLLDSVSIIVPAYNEEGNIERTIDELIEITEESHDLVEIIVINDGSIDKTGEIIEKYAENYPFIKAYHNRPNKGLGYTYRKGVELATKNYITLVPGDGEICKDSIKTYLALTGYADIIIPFIQNYWIRPLSRQFLSKTFTMLVNAISGLNITYYNGPVIHKAELLKKRKINADGFGYQAELLVKMIKEGASFVQVSMLLQPRRYGATSALNLKNFIDVAKTLYEIFSYCYLRKDKSTT